MQEGFVFDEGAGLYDQDQQYDPTSATNQVRGLVASWRSLPNRNQWQVTPETARLLQHWRHQKFSGVRPFFCQVEAVETAIWLTVVAPQSKAGKGLPDQLAAANQNANYRTPYQIRAQADRLLGPTVTDVDGISETRNDTISVFNGPPPTILSFKTEAEEIAAVGEWMAAVIALGSLGHVKYVLSVSLQACQSSPSRGACGGLAGA